jgi:hypothetical protein
MVGLIHLAEGRSVHLTFMLMRHPVLQRCPGDHLGLDE